MSRAKSSGFLTLAFGMALMSVCASVSATQCSLQTLTGAWGFMSSNSAEKKHGLQGDYTFIMRARLRPDGTLTGTYTLNRWGYTYRAWWSTTGTYTVSKNCGVTLFWRDAGGFRYSARGFATLDGKSLSATGQADGYAFSLTGARM
ncbi:MAG: hypothetical protein RL434_154 [Pseudomonadota bacterium]|jgi:hypothetical protein